MELFCKMQTQIFILATLVLLPLGALLIIFFVDEAVNYRLPTHIIPELYNITIHPFMEKEDGELQYKFQGDIHIRIKPLIETKLIVMHTVELNYTLLQYWPVDKPLAAQRLNKLRFDHKTQRIIFNLRDALHANKTYNLHFQYLGKINSEFYGVFRNEWQDEHNVSRWAVATVMEPADARRVFPCFDEPKFKANFVMNIIRPTHMSSHSNTKRVCSYVMGNYTRDRFAETPKMSTYTVAFLVSPFVERKTHGYGVLAQEKDLNLTSFNLDVGRSFLNVLGVYLDFDYYDMGIDKLQFAAMIKLNFAGMENWGLVVSTAGGILYNNSQPKNFEREFDVIYLTAHELAHMWFGNLVTCDWWSYVWLNEGFATYFSYFGSALLDNGVDFEKWEISFVLQQFQSCLSNNAKEQVLALNIYNNTAVGRNAYFIQTVYKKGASFIYMVKNVLGEWDFQRSLQEYLKTFKYKTATSQDICNIWSKYSPKNFKNSFLDFCNTYTEQPGYPLIIINITKDGKSFEISQQRFIGDFRKTAKKPSIFTVPISFTTDLETNFAQTQPIFYLTKEKAKFNITSKTHLKWLIANVRGTGLYRVHYNKENWRQIGQALIATNFSNIPMLSRAQLVDDIQHLFCAGFVDVELFLSTLNYLNNENHFAVWRTAFNGFTRILKFFVYEYDEFSFYMQYVLEEIYKTLGFLKPANDEDSFITALRKQIVEWSCKYGVTACMKDCNYFLNHTEEYSELDNDQRFMIHCTIIRHGNQTVYEEFFNEYANSRNTTAKWILARALGCVKEKSLIETHFWNILNEMMQNDKLAALQSFFNENISNYFSIYQLIAQNFDKVSQFFGGDVKVAEQIKKMSVYFSKIEQKQHLNEFTEKMLSTKNETISKILQQAHQAIDVSSLCFN